MCHLPPSTAVALTGHQASVSSPARLLEAPRAQRCPSAGRSSEVSPLEQRTHTKETLSFRENHGKQGSSTLRPSWAPLCTEHYRGDTRPPRTEGWPCPRSLGPACPEHRGDSRRGSPEPLRPSSPLLSSRRTAGPGPWAYSPPQAQCHLMC